MGQWLTITRRGSVHARPSNRNSLQLSICKLGEEGFRIGGEREDITCGICRRMLGMEPLTKEQKKALQNKFKDRAKESIEYEC